MIRAVLFLLAGVLPGAQTPDVQLYESVLQEYVRDDGRVDYAGLKKDSAALDQFVSQIGSVSPDSSPGLFATKQDRLAYWINTYNALVLKAFAKEYPEKRERLKGLFGKAQFFYKMKHNVGGQQRTLADIEDKSIRTMGDPRIHFAIVCASAGCPWLSRTAYTATNLETQLEKETRRYFSQPRNFRLNEARGEVWLPKIFDWFKADFGTPAATLNFVARYRPAEANTLQSRKWRIRYFDYDWSPNDVR